MSLTPAKFNSKFTPKKNYRNPQGKWQTSSNHWTFTGHSLVFGGGTHFWYQQTVGQNTWSPLLLPKSSSPWLWLCLCKELGSRFSGWDACRHLLVGCLEKNPKWWFTMVESLETSPTKHIQNRNNKSMQQKTQHLRLDFVYSVNTKTDSVQTCNRLNFVTVSKDQTWSSKLGRSWHPLSETWNMWQKM